MRTLNRLQIRLDEIREITLKENLCRVKLKEMSVFMLTFL